MKLNNYINNKKKLLLIFFTKKNKLNEEDELNNELNDILKIHLNVNNKYFKLKEDD
jgi:hypothetical protein